MTERQSSTQLCNALFASAPSVFTASMRSTIVVSSVFSCRTSVTTCSADGFFGRAGSDFTVCSALAHAPATAACASLSRVSGDSRVTENQMA